MEDSKRNPYPAICDILFNAVRSAIAYLDREEPRQAGGPETAAPGRIFSCGSGQLPWHFCAGPVSKKPGGMQPTPPGFRLKR